MSTRVALVTGAASGIGLATAKQFLLDGHRVAMVDRSSDIEKIAREHGDNATPLIADVGRADDVRAVMHEVEKRFGRCDILVNNAGIHPKKDGGKWKIEEIPLEQWNDVLAINLTASFLFCQLALPLMRKQGWGRIVNISSRGGRTVSPVASAHYAATKAGMIGFTRILALEGAPDRITANCVAPGPIETAMTAGSSAEVRAAFAKAVPLGRYGDPQDIAATVAFLASDAAAFITGAVFDVNGGTYMP
jgi:NAD(P)-dependent dehydrogenase (short-subunit alcohol dehydrogenase family)